MKKETIVMILMISELLYSKELVNQKELHCSSKTPAECYSLTLEKVHYIILKKQ